jgi:hypothetical protein
LATLILGTVDYRDLHWFSARMVEISQRFITDLQVSAGFHFIVSRISSAQH